MFPSTPYEGYTCKESQCNIHTSCAWILIIYKYIYLRARYAEQASINKQRKKERSLFPLILPPPSIRSDYMFVPDLLFKGLTSWFVLLILEPWNACPLKT